jgi:hypothetical protein
MRAFVSITSKEVMTRTLAYLRSLEATGALVDATCYLLCLDNVCYAALQAHVPESVKLLTLQDVPELNELSKRPHPKLAYFAYACKPYLMRWALDNGAEQILYCDIDLWFVQNPSFLFDYLTSNDVLIIPATIDTEATTSDWPRQVRSAQRTGYYNAGLVGCSSKGRAFLDWWADRCAFGTGYDFYLDMSSDQKYLNWVPSLFPNVFVLRHHGVNVKPFSAEYASFERQANGVATIGGDPLVYFHFSQNMGGLANWPSKFYPEVGCYLDEVEKARLDLGQPYVDMSRRDNADHARPLIPQAGKMALLFNQTRNLQRVSSSTRSNIRSSVARGVRLLPSTVRQSWARAYLAQWKLEGDVNPESYGEILGTDNVKKILFFGISRLAYYLAYMGRQVTIYEPFQGHYNSALCTVFNTQVSQAQQMIDLLGIRSNLTLHRQHFNSVPSPLDFDTVFVSARREPGCVGDTLTMIASSSVVKRLGILFDSSWPVSYRELYRSALKETAPDLQAINEVDLYRIG